MISAKIVADSACEESGVRITTFELVMPKSLLAQFNKHNLVRNSAESSRARPTHQILKQINDDPYKPPQWNYRQRGMQPAGPMSSSDAQKMDELEGILRRFTAQIVREMEHLKASKEDINRYLEPWMFCTVVATATDWDNYWKLRVHGDAQGAHRMLAEEMLLAYKASLPRLKYPRLFQDIETGFIPDWHLPYVTQTEIEDITAPLLPQISAARCGRASYGRAGEAKTVEEDVDRAQQFVRDGHWTPLEGPARLTLDPDARYGAYRAWMPLRKHYAGESGTPGLGCQEDIQPWAYRQEKSDA